MTEVFVEQLLALPEPAKSTNQRKVIVLLVFMNYYCEFFNIQCSHR